MRDFFDLRDSDFGLVQPTYQSIANGSRQYLNKMGISYAEQKAKYPASIGYYESKGWTQSRIMGLTQFTVAFNEAAMRNQFNRASIKIPAGFWAVNAQLKATMGTIEGVGPAGAADEGPWGTHLTIEGVQWMDDPLNRNIFVSWNKFENKYEWSHTTKIRQMSLGGEMKMQRDTSYQSSAILMQNPGECCIIEDIYCTGWNDFGVHIDGGGAPCTIHNSSYFYNHRAGIGIGSAAISVVRISEPSGDLNPYMVETFVGSDGSPGGGTITLISPKIEAYGNPNAHARPGRGQMLAKFVGYYRVHIIGGQQWVHGAYIDSAIRCESENVQGGLYDNYVRWDGLHAVNCEHLLHDVSNNKKFKSGGNWASGIHDIVWTSKAGGRAITTFLPNDSHTAVAINADLPHVVATHKGRMPFINAGPNGLRDGNWDQSTGAIVGATPNPITGIVMTPASTQVNKGQTVALSATVQGTGTFDGTVQWNIITGGGSLNKTTTAAGEQVIFTAAEYAVDNDAFTQVRAVANGNKNVMAAVDIVIKATAVTNVVTGISAVSSKPTLDEGTTATLTATVTGTGTFNNGVTWSIASGGGTLSSTSTNPVTYTAPQVGADTNVVVKATSVGDPTKYADIPMIVKNVVVVPPVSITSVSVAPATGQVDEGSNILLTATVAGTGAFNQNVTWTVMSGGGTLSSPTSNPVTYVAPQVAADTPAVIRAVAVGDTTKFASSTITVKNVTTPSTITSVTATATPSSIESSQTSAISATVNGTGPFNTSVTWTIVSGGGTLASSTSNATTYTAPVVTTSTNIVLKATANGDATKSTTITIIVSPASTGTVELPRTGWIGTASHYNTAGSNEPAANALDGNASTYWTGGIAQSPGQWFQVDMLAQKTFNRVVIETSSLTFTDYARGVQVYVSNDGVNWGTAVGTAVGAAGTQYVVNSLTINFASQTARYIRVTLNASSTGNWWAIGNFRVFGGGTTPPPTGAVTSVSIAANPVSVNSGQATTLTATVAGTGTFNNAVTWTIVSGGGTLSNTANNPVTYTAPTTTTDITPQIRATSVGDTTKTAIINLPVKGVTVPPATGGINPASVLMVVNANDPSSDALANQYAAAWGIPLTNKVTVNLGTSHVIADGPFATERAKVLAASTAAHEHYALCFAFPSRVGPTGILNSMQSITSAMVYGRRNVTTLTTNTLLNYNGLKPFTDKGVRASWLVMKSAYIKRSAHGARPTGMMYAVSSKDQNPPARGSVRASQCQALDSRANFEHIDIRAVTDIGYGQNPYQTPQNWAFDKYAQLFAQYGSQGGWPQADPRGKLFTKQPLAAAFLAMNNYDRLEEMVRQPGWVGDCVTSFAGYMPDGAGQTPLTYMLDLGASTACGLVAEPSSNFVPQFTDLTKFVPMWHDQKLPNAVAFWGSTQAIDRMLIAGDGMCAPFI